jgi:hypothetical protein
MKATQQYKMAIFAENWPNFPVHKSWYFGYAIKKIKATQQYKMAILPKIGPTLSPQIYGTSGNESNPLK